MTSASDFIKNLITLGCPRDYVENVAAGVAWISGRLSAYGIEVTEQDDPEELVRYLMSVKGQLPHQDDSLVRRDPPAPPKKAPENFVDMKGDEQMRTKVKWFAKHAIQPVSDGETVYVSFKKHGFRYFVKRNQLTETIVNVQSMRLKTNELGKEVIYCSVSFRQFDFTEMMEFLPERFTLVAKDTHRIPAVHSVEMVDCLVEFANNGMALESIERACANLEYVNQRQERKNQEDE